MNCGAEQTTRLHDFACFLAIFSCRAFASLSLRCVAVRPSFSFAVGLPAFSARAAARALSVSRWLPRDMLQCWDEQLGDPAV